MQNKGLLQLYMSNTDLKLVLSWEWHRQPSRVTTGVQLLEKVSQGVFQWYSWADLIAHELAGVEPFRPFSSTSVVLGQKTSCLSATTPARSADVVTWSHNASAAQPDNLVTSLLFY